MFSVFDVPNEFEGGIRIHFNFFLLGFGDDHFPWPSTMGVADSSGRESGRPGKLFLGKIFRNPEGRFRFSRPSAEIPARSLQKVTNFGTHS